MQQCCQQAMARQLKTASEQFSSESFPLRQLSRLLPSLSQVCMHSRVTEASPPTLLAVKGLKDPG